MAAGSVDALAQTADHRTTQPWSRYFYDHPEIYGEIDGIIYASAHNSEDSIALYERARIRLDLSSADVVLLKDLGSHLLKAMDDALLVFESGKVTL